MAKIEEVLWNIFTCYSLNGNPRDPSRLNGSGLLKLCRDTKTLDPIMTESPMTQAYLDLIYTSEIKSPKKIRSSQAEKSDKLDFDQFLSCLIRIAVKCYPSGKTRDESMQQLLMDNILPNAAKRKPVSITSFLRQPTIEALFKYYEGALSELFKFYAMSSDQNVKGKNLIRATSNIVKTFDDQKGLIEEAKTRSHIHNSSSGCIGYADFMRFANDFAMTTSLGLTSLELGDIYLTVISSNNFSPTLRKIDFTEFWEALVRSALVAFKDKPKITTENKVKGLFHYIWRNTQTSTQDHMISYGTLGGGGFNTYRGGLLKGASLLNEKFIVAWTRDDYRDYLQLDHKKSSNTSNFEHHTEKLSSSSSSKAPLSASASLGSSMMSKLLAKTGTAHSDSPSKSASNSAKPTPVKAAGTNSLWAQVGEDDDINGDPELRNLLHETIDKQENFNVKTPEGLVICVKIRDEDRVGEVDGRINVEDLRRLLALKPEIAGILFECMVEEGIATAPEGSMGGNTASSNVNKYFSDDENADEDEKIENMKRLLATPGNSFIGGGGLASRKSSRGQSLHLGDLHIEEDDEEQEEGKEEVDGDDLDAIMDGLVDDEPETGDGENDD